MIPGNNKLWLTFLDRDGIRFKFWKYFVSFAFTILIMLWLLQIVFLNQFYESMKVDEIEKIGSSMMEDFGKEDFAMRILVTSFTKGIGISVYDDEGWRIYPEERTGDIFRQRARMGSDQFRKFFTELNAQKRTNIFTERFEGSENYELIYTGLLGSDGNKLYYILINTPLEPVESTIDILRTQLIIVSIISLIGSLILSYFLSSRLARPLVKMSETAKDLGEGNLDVVFEKGDYTEVNELAKTLNHATEELTKTIEMRKDLIANVSHDLKTPLTVIKSYGEMVRDISGDNRELRNRHIDIIIHEADTLTALVNDLLDLSKVESELADLKKVPFNLEETVRDVLKRFSILEEKQGYQFTLEVEGDPTVFGDENKIRQVIYNFITNGVNYSTDKKLVEIRIIGNDKETRCEVKDYGIGIEKEQQEQIWDRYYRVRQNHKRPVVGTGLGLYIVKNILELHGFDYGVESVLGQGSTFYFVAPKS